MDERRKKPTDRQSEKEAVLRDGKLPDSDEESEVISFIPCQRKNSNWCMSRLGPRNRSRKRRLSRSRSQSRSLSLRLDEGRNCGIGLATLYHCLTLCVAEKRLWCLRRNLYVAKLCLEGRKRGVHRNPFLNVP